jgi:hypothetical protein
MTAASGRMHGTFPTQHSHNNTTFGEEPYPCIDLITNCAVLPSAISVVTILSSELLLVIICERCAKTISTSSRTNIYGRTFRAAEIQSSGLAGRAATWNEAKPQTSSKSWFHFPLRTTREPCC